MGKLRKTTENYGTITLSINGYIIMSINTNIRILKLTLELTRKIDRKYTITTNTYTKNKK